MKEMHTKLRKLISKLTFVDAQFCLGELSLFSTLAVVLHYNNRCNVTVLIVLRSA